MNISPVARWQVLDILRGFCCLSVVFFHSLGAFEETLHPALMGFRLCTNYGWIAVHFFFVLSGWCMAERLAYSKMENEKPVIFALNRMFRIYPVYWAVLVMALLLRLAAIPFNQTPWTSNLPSGPAAAMGDLVLSYEFIPQTPYLLVAWSLGIEIIFYLACTLALYLSRRGISALVILTCGIVACIVFQQWPLPIAKTFLANLPHFLWGTLAWALCFRPRQRPVYLVLLLLSSLPVFFLRQPETADWATLLFTFLILLLCLAGVSWKGGKLTGLLAGLGTISYSLYLIHVPVLSPFLNFSKRYVSVEGPAFIMVWLAALALTLLAGFIVYQTVEKKSEHLRKRLLSPHRTQKHS